MKLIIEKSVCVITPTIGKKELLQCTESVARQTYKNLHHLVVVDGGEFFESAFANTSALFECSRIQITCAPYNTGGNGFYGHRIYAAYPHLVNHDYIFFLDEDNWYDENHVSSLVDLMESKNLDWSYSLRNIYSKNGHFIEKDCCESLGKWPIFWSTDNDPKFLIDTSCYAFKREFIVQVCHLWHSAGGGWGADRVFYEMLSKVYKHTNYDTTGLHTMNYRLDDEPKKKYGSDDFFTTGNLVTLQRYGQYPWIKESSK